MKLHHQIVKLHCLGEETNLVSSRFGETSVRRTDTKEKPCGKGKEGKSNTRRINLGTKRYRYAHLEESKKVVTMRDWNIEGLSQKEMASAPLFWEIGRAHV